MLSQRDAGPGRGGERYSFSVLVLAYYPLCIFMQVSDDKIVLFKIYLFLTGK